MTGAAYVKTKGTHLAALTAATDRIVAQVPDGATLCIVNQPREAILYSSVFHANRHYRTKVLTGEQPDPACTLRLDTTKGSVERVR